MLQHSKPFHGQHELSALINEGNNNEIFPVVDEEAEELDIRPTTGATHKIDQVTLLRQAFRRKEWDLVNFYLRNLAKIKEL